MQYKGKLYGKVGNGYFPLSLSADEVDLFCGFGGTTTGFADVPTGGYLCRCGLQGSSAHTCTGAK